MQQLVARPVQALTEQEEDYLLFCLSDPRLAQFFYRHAHDPSWLNWAVQHSILSPLFKSSEDFNEGGEVADWFARDPLSARGEIALQIASKARHLCWRLWSAVAHSVWRSLSENRVSPEAAQYAAQWLAILDRHSEASSNNEIVSYWLKELLVPDHTFLAVHLFEYLTRPVSAAESGLRSGRDGSWERALRPVVKIRGDNYWLQEAWTNFFTPNLNLFAYRLAPLVFFHLQQAYLLLRSQGVATNRWDPLSYDRSAIEQHEQNAHGPREAFYILVDAARDILDWFLREDSRNAWSYIEISLAMEAPLVRRLGIYGLSRYAGLSSSAKIASVVDRGWLEEWLLKHEVFQLLRSSYGESRPTVRRRLLRAAERAILYPEDAAEDSADDIIIRCHQLFDLFCVLEAADPSCPLVAKALRRIRRENPDFRPSSHPDFGHWSSGVQAVQVVSPVPKDNLLRLEPAEWITEYIRVTNAERDQLIFEDPVQGFLLETENVASQEGTGTRNAPGC